MQMFLNVERDLKSDLTNSYDRLNFSERLRSYEEMFHHRKQKKENYKYYIVLYA